MKLYYLCDKNVQLGPFSFDQLISKGINYNTLIWKDGYIGWAKAGEVNEFNDILSPPAAPVPPVKETNHFTISKSLGWISLIILIVLKRKKGRIWRK